MASSFKLVAGNTAPSYTLTLERDNGDGTTSPINLTGCTVVLVIKSESTVTNVGSSCVISSPATAGNVVFTPVSTDFPQAGKYKADAKITYSNSTVEIVYEQALFKVRAKLA